MKKWLHSYFALTKREYNALLVLFGLIFLVIVTPYCYEKFLLNETPIIPLEKDAIKELTFVRKQEYENNTRKYRYPKFKRDEISFFQFDPNQIGLTEWKKLGLSPKQAQSIINYRNKGGKFYKPEDLKKMYAITPALFKSLQPYITIKGDFVNKKPAFESKTYPKRELLIVEINNADTVGLDQIKGIGAAFARRIVNYRNRLGGFYKKEQLLEVFGIDSLKFEEIKGQVMIDHSTLRKININTADFEALKTHPYLKYKQINAIIQYRKQHGNFSGIADLKKILILSPQTIDQLTPYLQF